jgi:hypothetical protein
MINSDIPSINDQSPTPTLPSNDNNLKESVEDIWKQTEINLCLLVAMLKEKERKNTSKSPIISEAISNIENAPLPEPLEKIKCNSDVIAPILDKIKKTMKIINKDMTEEQIIDLLLVSNISIIKKYIQLYLDIIKNIDKSAIDVSDTEFETGIDMFLAISKKLDDLLNSMSSLNIEQDEQAQGQGKSISNAESAELVLGLVSGFFTTAQILGGKKGKKNKRSKKNKERKSRKSRRYRKPIK